MDTQIDRQARQASTHQKFPSGLTDGNVLPTVDDFDRVAVRVSVTFLRRGPVAIAQESEHLLEHFHGDVRTEQVVGIPFETHRPSVRPSVVPWSPLLPMLQPADAATAAMRNAAFADA